MTMIQQGVEVEGVELQPVGGGGNAIILRCGNWVRIFHGRKFHWTKIKPRQLPQWRDKQEKNNLPNSAQAEVVVEHRGPLEFREEEEGVQPLGGLGEGQEHHPVLDHTS